jgi:hypothetical protein
LFIASHPEVFLAFDFTPDFRLARSAKTARLNSQPWTFSLLIPGFYQSPDCEFVPYLLGFLSKSREKAIATVVVSILLKRGLRARRRV